MPSIPASSFSFVTLSNKTKRPWGLTWRSSNVFITIVVGLGIATELAVYGLIVPVVPFRLEQMGYHEVGSLNGWLLFAYSAGLAVSTPPIGYFSERHSNRRTPLLLAQILLAASILLFMFSPTLAGMFVGRVGQGIGSAGVWVLGLALVCDSVPEDQLGRYMGAVSTSFTVGRLIGPPLGGVLYEHGWHYPFVLALGLVFVDFLGRLLVIEKHISRAWQPSDSPQKDAPSAGLNDLPYTTAPLDAAAPVDPEKLSVHTVGAEARRPSSGLAVLVSLLRSPVCILGSVITFAYGFIAGGRDTALTLRLNHLYGYSSEQVGLTYIAAVGGSFIASPLTGYLTDKIGAKWTTIGAISTFVPFAVLLGIRTSATVCIVFLAFFGAALSGILSPVMSEFGRAARGLPGVGYAHTYSLFNLAYGIAACVGPIVGGQVYDRVSNGWLVLCILFAVMMGMCIPPAMIWMEDKTRLSAIFLRRKRRSAEEPHELDSPAQS